MGTVRSWKPAGLEVGAQRTLFSVWEAAEGDSAQGLQGVNHNLATDYWPEPQFPHP